MSLRININREKDLTRITLEGELDEHADLEKGLKGLDGMVIFDLKGVTKINSIGVNKWIRSQDSLGKSCDIQYECCPVSMVDQSNTIINFWANGRVTSFFAPYFCNTCKEPRDILIDMAKLLSEIEKMRIMTHKCPECVNTILFNENEDLYFQFLEGQADPGQWISWLALVSQLSIIVNRYPYIKDRADTLKNKSIIFLDPTHHDWNCPSICRDLNMNVKECDSFTQVMDEIRKRPCDIISAYCDVDENITNFLNELNMLDRVPWLVLTPLNPVPGALKEVLQKSFCINMIGKGLPLGVSEVIITLAKLTSRDIFGIDKYLSNAAMIKKDSYIDSDGRSRTIERIEEFAGRNVLKRNAMINIQTFSDEVLSNALYNAPVDETGQPRYRYSDRKQPVALKEDEEIVVEYAIDGRYFVIGVIDPFGSMEYKYLSEFMIKLLGPKEKIKPRTTNGGAGLGLLMTLNSVNSLVINLEPGVRTEVIGIIDIKSPLRSHGIEGRSVHFFVSEKKI